MLNHFIDRVVLPGIPQLPIRGLIAVVGPNSSGKTRFLNDLVFDGKRESEKARRTIVCQDVVVTPPPSFDDLIDELERHGTVAVQKSPDGKRKQIQVHGSVLGKGEPIAAHSMEYHSTLSHFNSFHSSPEARNAFLKSFGPILTTFMFLENRLKMITKTELFDFSKQKPKNELQTLHVNTPAQEALNKEIGHVFGKGIGPDASDGSLRLRVTETKSPTAPHFRAGDFVKHRNIEEEGDGLRSYVAICIGLLASYRPLCLIDEPEAYLHPPQAYALGRFIGNQANEGRTTVVATHSSHVLRGLVEANRNMSVVRLVRVKGRFLAHHVPSITLQDSVSRPSVRADEVFDGIFSDGVVIVEADSDRTVYQAAYLASVRDFHLDAQFLAVGSHSGIAPAAEFYRTLSVPCVAIADLDVIMLSRTEIERLLSSLGARSEAASSILEQITEIQEAVKRTPTLFSRSIAENELKQYIVDGENWDNDEDIRMVRGLRGLAHRIDRNKRIKLGVEAFADQPELQQKLKTIITKCADQGLFLVPVGELESWLTDAALDDSTPKAERAAAAIHSIRTAPETASSLIEFALKVGRELNERRYRSLDEALAAQTMAPTEEPVDEESVGLLTLK